MALVFFGNLTRSAKEFAKVKALARQNIAKKR
jgi:hypothetical protein